MLTKFGKLLRMIRLENGEYAKDMADSLKVTPAYLSAVEHGKREVPNSWIAKLSEIYHLNNITIDKLTEAANETKGIVQIHINDMSEKNRKLANAFARKLENLESDDIEKMLKILNQAGKEK